MHWHASCFIQSYFIKMTLPTTSKHQLVLKDYEAIINACNAFTSEPQLAETVQIIVIEEKHKEIDDTRRENKFRAITSILTDCSKHRKLEALKWHTGPDDSSTRPAEFWEALNKVAPNLQHLSFNFYTHELHRMKEMGILVRGRIFLNSCSRTFLVFNALLSFRPSFLRNSLS